MSIFFRAPFERAFGTYPLKGDALAAAMTHAAEAGYRAFDTAQMYGNEADVGRALAGLGLPRGEVLVATKVHPDNFTPERFLPSVRKSLEDLRLDAADVLFLHWPPAGGEVRPSLELLQSAREAGLTRHVAVSNYTAAMMRTAKDFLGVPLVSNQVEFHPLLDQSTLLAAAAETRIPLSAYCSLARGEVFKHALFEELGREYRRSAGQVALRWILQKGVSINTMSTSRENIRSNFDVMDFTLSGVAMTRIDALGPTNLRIVTSDKVPWAPVWD